MRNNYHSLLLNTEEKVIISSKRVNTLLELRVYVTEFFMHHDAQILKFLNDEDQTDKSANFQQNERNKSITENKQTVAVNLNIRQNVWKISIAFLFQNSSWVKITSSFNRTNIRKYSEHLAALKKLVLMRFSNSSRRGTTLNGC